MAVINAALTKCSLLYEDGLDIHLTTKIDADRQLKGHQKRVITPGQNMKYYLASAQHSGTWKVSYVGAVVEVRSCLLAC